MYFKLLRLVLPLLVLVFVLPMIMPGPDGKPVMNWRDWLPDKSTIAPVADVLEDTNGAGQPATQAFYRWQDEQGRWHFSDSPPPDTVLADQANAGLAEQLPVVTNRMDALPQAEPEQAATTSTDSGGLPFSPTTVPLQDIPKLIEDAKKVQQLVDKRYQEIDQY